MAGPGRSLTLARHAIFHEAAFQPGLQRKIAAGRAALAQVGVPWLAVLGSADPPADFGLLLDLIAGLLFNQLAAPQPGFDPTRSIARVLSTMDGSAPRPDRAQRSGSVARTDVARTDVARTDIAGTDGVGTADATAVSRRRRAARPSR